MTPATGNPRKFHKGPPPFPGWWWVRAHGFMRDWRWWNGSFWSVAAYRHESGRAVKVWASQKTVTLPEQIDWSDYWPANARVPRINPNKETA